MAEITYTYNPADIAENTVSRARFELGDVDVYGERETCFLSDQEIQAIITATANAHRSWKWTLYRLADAVCMRLSYETDWKDDGTAFSLNQRAERWMKLRDKLKQEAELEECEPDSGAVNDTLNAPDGGHYFRRNMTNSPYVQPPYVPGGELP